MRKESFASICALILCTCSCSAPQRSESQPEGSSVYDRLVLELDSTEIYNDTIIYGYWFKPHEANAFNVFLHKDHTYEFHYYDGSDESDIRDVESSGEFTVNGDTITMITVMEESGQAVSLKMIHKWNGTNYYLTDEGGDTYLVKGSD